MVRPGAKRATVRAIASSSHIHIRSDARVFLPKIDVDEVGHVASVTGARAAQTYSADGKNPLRSGTGIILRQDYM